MKPLKRHSPTVENLAWGSLFFWDGRADSLEAQALGPIESDAEMSMALGDLDKKLASIKGYKPLFEAAYPGEGTGTKVVAKAIATYERTLVSNDTPFDEWVKGDTGAISEAAKRGFVLFNTKGFCSKCHGGDRFTDDGFHDIGLKGDDRGRGVLLEDIDSVQYAFKTPGLRNIARRAPYLHDGSAATLTDLVRFYNKGGDVTLRPSKSDDVKKLGLSDSEVVDIVEFLQTLTSNDREVVYPALPY
jgi:cytochrome c peroxidase